MNIVIILSGGIGSRMHLDFPKQYILVNEKPIIMYSIETFAQRKDIDAFVIVIANEWISFFENYLNHEIVQQPIYYATPGATRQLSVYNSLKVASKISQKLTKKNIVIIHDAARPLVTNDIIDCCIQGCNEFDGVLPAIKAKDTIYQSQDGLQISNLLKRNELFCGQTPESFVLDKYYQIHIQTSPEEMSMINGSSEIAFSKGLKIKLAPGNEVNFKITTPEDVKAFEQLIKR